MTVRLAVAVCAALAAFAATAGVAAGAEPDAAAKLFAARCAACHSAARVVRKVKAIAAADREARLKAFLARHHSPGETERETLIRYLLARAAR